MPEIHLSQKEIEVAIEAVDDAMGKANDNRNEEDIKQLQAVLRKLMQESESHS